MLIYLRVEPSHENDLRRVRALLEGPVWIDTTRKTAVGVGTHVLAELFGVPKARLSKVAVVREIMHRIMREAGFTSVGETFHQFEPDGVTGIILLSESHFSVHTWPEKEMLAADIFSCSGREHALRALTLLQSYFEPRTIGHKIVER
jgi:S-adenosylmethionine decarboxylase proenzyme